MAHFAKVENGVVTDVIVADQEFIDTGLVGDPSMWIQTSYNTRMGSHALDGAPLRKNFAGIGYLYNEEHDLFCPPKPFESWVLDVETGQWEAPIPRPEEPSDPTKTYLWNEQTQEWGLTDSVLPNIGEEE